MCLSMAAAVQQAKLHSTNLAPQAATAAARFIQSNGSAAFGCTSKRQKVRQQLIQCEFRAGAAQASAICLSLRLRAMKDEYRFHHARSAKGCWIMCLSIAAAGQQAKFHSTNPNLTPQAATAAARFISRTVRLPLGVHLNGKGSANSSSNANSALVLRRPRLCVCLCGSER